MKMLGLTSLQQLEMLKHMRNFHLDDQSAILEKVTAFMLLKPTRDIDDMDLQR